MVFVKKIELFIVCVFWANQDREDRFFVILDKKKSFLDQKKEVLKNDKKSKFSKGVLVHGFCQKMEIFITY